PVPHLNGQLASPIHNFLSRLKPGTAWCRANWGLSRSPELNQHPARGLPKFAPPLREDEVWLRVEDQVLVALPESCGVLFGIRMTVLPLVEVKRHPAAVCGLARALQTMPDAMLEYKSLLAAKDELLRLLQPQS
ncbi:MAG: heme-dependent oxidative N-demethylase subunit alpha family protein, partial [Limisphaerales bacterium]